MVRAAFFVDWRHVVDGVIHGDGDTESRSHDHNKDDGCLGEAEPEDGKRHPADARQSLHTHDQRAQIPLQELKVVHEDTEDAAQYQRDHVADGSPQQAESDGGEQAAIFHQIDKALPHAGRRRHGVCLPDGQPVHSRKIDDLPQYDDGGQKKNFLYDRCFSASFFHALSSSS